MMLYHSVSLRKDRGKHRHLADSYVLLWGRVSWKVPLTVFLCEGVGTLMNSVAATLNRSPPTGVTFGLSFSNSRFTSAILASSITCLLHVVAAPVNVESTAME